MRKYLLFLALFFASNMAYSQYYFNTPIITPSGNPSNLNWDNEEPFAGQSGWSSIQPASHPAWTATQTIPFAFLFNGSAVTTYKVSTTGLLTFTANPSNPSGLHNTIPSSSLPDNTVCVWGLGYNGTSSNDRIIKKVFGIAPNRQLWIQWASYNNEALTNKCWTYWSVVLEETSNRIYIVDQRSPTKGGCGPLLTLGVQVNSTTAYMVPGSPNLGPLAGDSKTPYDNKFYEFIPGNRPVYDIGVDYIQTNQYQTASVPVEIRGTLKTYGSATVTSYDINYSIDNGPTQVQHITSNLPIYSTEWYFHDSIWLPSIGDYLLKVWCSNINGNQDQNIYNDTLSKVVNVLGIYVPRIGVHEVFESANSDDCKGVYDSLKNVFDLHPTGYSYITYAMPSDIYANADGIARGTYYDVDSLPDMFLNGVVNIDPRYYNEQIYYDNAKPAYLSIAPNISLNGNTLTAGAAILPFPSWVNPTDPIAVHIAIVEKTTTGNIGTNGETMFHNILRKMLPNSAGTIKSFTPGIYVNVSQNYTFQTNEVENIKNLEAIVFVQNTVTKEIYQSASLGIPNAINQASTPTEGITNLFPNPAQETSEITYFVNNSSLVGVKVYDATGKLVFDGGEYKKNQGTHHETLDTKGYSQGLYYVQLNISNKLYYKKLIVN